MAKKSSRGLNRVYIFMLTGFSATEKRYLIGRISELGGSCSDDDNGFDRNCTHVVCKKPSRSEKFLAGCATGKWIIEKGFIDDSHRAGAFLVETEYEWCDTPRWRQCLPTELHSLLSAPRRWRMQYENTGFGPFQGWRAAVCVKNPNKNTVYKRLLTLGGATLENVQLPITTPRARWRESVLGLTHVFVDEKNARFAVPLLRADIYCLQPVYIGDFLVQPSTLDPLQYLVGPVGGRTSCPSTPNTPNQVGVIAKTGSATPQNETNQSETRKGQNTVQNKLNGAASCTVADKNNVESSKHRSRPSSSQTNSRTKSETAFSSQPVSKTKNMKSKNRATAVNCNELPLSQPTVMTRSRSNSLSSNQSAESDSSLESKRRSSRRKTMPAFPLDGKAASTKTVNNKNTVNSAKQTGAKSKGRDVEEKMVSVGGAKFNAGDGTSNLGASVAKANTDMPNVDVICTPVKQTSLKIISGKDHENLVTVSPIGSKENPIFIEQRDIPAHVLSFQVQSPAKFQVRSPAKSQASPARPRPRGRKLHSKDSPAMKRFTQGTLNGFIRVKKVEPSCTITPPPSPVWETSTPVPIPGASLPISSASVPVLSTSVPKPGTSVPMTSASVPIPSTSVPISSTSVPTPSASVPETSKSPPVCVLFDVTKTSQTNTESASIPTAESNKQSKVIPETQKPARKTVRRRVLMGAGKGDDGGSDGDVRVGRTESEQGDGKGDKKGGRQGDKGDRESGTKRKSSDSSLLMNGSFHKRQKMSGGLYKLPWTASDPVIVIHSLHETRTAGDAVAMPAGEAYTRVVEGLVEDEFYSEAVDMIDSCMNSTSYPQCQALHILIHDILLKSECALLSMKAYSLLCKVLSHHAPVTSALQQLYMTTMGAERAQDSCSQHSTQLWPVFTSFIRNAIEEIEEEKEPCNNLLMVRFYTHFFEKDFQAFLNRYHSRRTGVAQTHACVVAQLLWPSGALATGHFNIACQDLLRLLFDCVKIENATQRYIIISCLQTILGVVVQMCWNCDHHSNHSIHSYRTSEKLSIFSKELAMNAEASLSYEQLELLLGTMKLPWFTALVCEQMLEFYDESLLPLVTDKSRVLSMAEIVAKHFYLLPPLTTGDMVTSPHKKRRHKLNFFPKQERQQQTSKTNITTVENNNDKAGNISTQQAKVPSSALKRKMAAINKQNHKGETQLHRACIANNTNKVKELLDIPGIDVNVRDYAGWTALHEACNRGHADVVLLLLKYRPAQTILNFFNTEKRESKRVDLLAASEEEGLTPLHDAVQNNNLQVVRLLLQYGGQTLLEAKCHEGKTALEYACSADMRDLLTNPPSNHMSTPNKRKYLSSDSQDSQLSQLSQLSMTSNPDTSLHSNCGHQPAAELYTEILESGSVFDSSSILESSPTSKYVSDVQLSIYVLIVFHLLKNYVQVEGLLNASSSRETARKYVVGQSQVMCNMQNCDVTDPSPSKASCSEKTIETHCRSRPHRTRKPTVPWSPSKVSKIVNLDCEKTASGTPWKRNNGELTRNEFQIGQIKIVLDLLNNRTLFQRGVRKKMLGMSC